MGGAVRKETLLIYVSSFYTSFSQMRVPNESSCFQEAGRNVVEKTGVWGQQTRVGHFEQF